MRLLQNQKVISVEEGAQIEDFGHKHRDASSQREAAKAVVAIRLKEEGNRLVRDCRSIFVPSTGSAQ